MFMIVGDPRMLVLLLYINKYPSPARFAAAFNNSSSHGARIMTLMVTRIPDERICTRDGMASQLAASCQGRRLYQGMTWRRRKFR